MPSDDTNGDASQMELDGAMVFSKFKYNFQNVIAELCVLRGRENSAKEEIESSMQKLRNLEADQAKQKALMQAQVSEANEARQKLEATVKLMGLESAGLEDKIKNLSLELKHIVDSRNSVTEELKVTNYELGCKLKKCSGQLSMTVEKLRRHTMLFEAAEKEVNSVKHLLEDTRKLVTSRDAAVLELQGKMDWMTSKEQKLIDRARSLECDVRNKQTSLCSKDKEIVTLKVALEEAKNGNVKESSVAMTFAETKDVTFSQLTEEKEELVREVERLRKFAQKLQEAASHQDSTLETLRQSLVEYKERTEKADDKLRNVENAETLLEEYKGRIEALEREKEMWIHEKDDLCLKNHEGKRKSPQVDACVSTSDLQNTQEQETCNHDQAEVSPAKRAKLTP